jgi:hypothetical protein
MRASDGEFPLHSTQFARMAFNGGKPLWPSDSKFSLDNFEGLKPSVDPYGFVMMAEKSSMSLMTFPPQDHATYCYAGSAQ